MKNNKDEKIPKSQKPNPVDIYVGSRLKFKRMEKGLSQSVLGNLLGLTFQQIQKYEKGLNRIGGGRLYDLSKILNVPISYFFENYESDNNYAKAGNNTEFENDIKTLTKYFCMIKNKSLRKSIIMLAKSLNIKDLNDSKE